jgi:uncharacterized membrane-anchored protein
MQSSSLVTFRAMDAAWPFWLAMFAASCLGTNLGDFWADAVDGRWLSFASLCAVSACAVWADRRHWPRTEAPYWIAIVALRAAATNVADFLTHDLGFSYPVCSAALLALTVAAGMATRMGAAASPLIDLRYWLAMLAAGLFGTVAGDMADHALGLAGGALLCCAALAGLLLLRRRQAGAAWLLYWGAVLAERCGGTSVGDSIASHRMVGLGAGRAMWVTGALLIGALAIRRYRGHGARPAGAMAEPAGMSPRP